MADDQDNCCEKAVLKGTLRSSMTNEDSLSSRVIAVLNLTIKKFTFSGARIDRAAANLNGGNHNNFKDDTNINKIISTRAYAKDVEYRF